MVSLYACRACTRPSLAPPNPRVGRRMRHCWQEVHCPDQNMIRFGPDGAQSQRPAGSGWNKPVAHQSPRPRQWRESQKSRLARAARLSAALAQLHPEARISLNFATPWQCLVATILSAHCTDERVNRTTPELFRRIPEVSAMATAPLEEIQRLIQSTGFFRQKSKALQA